MRGKHRITVQNKKIKYDFEIQRNITIIRGDSATGKTTLIDMIREYYENGVASGIDLKCDKICTVLEGRNWEVQLSVMHDSIIFIDEGNVFVSSKEFASMIQETDNYYVIVTRENLETLPYSVQEIYGIRDSGKYGYLKQTYNEMYHLYNLEEINSKVEPEKIITEDSNSGFQFFKEICQDNNLECISAGGKSNIFQHLMNENSKKILVIADGAAFGSQMDKIMYLVKEKTNIALYLPESFEWMILQSDILNDSETKEILLNPSEYIESKEYLSWERYFTSLLIRKTEDTYLKYTKRILNDAYVQENIKNKILKVMENVNL